MQFQFDSFQDFITMGGHGFYVWLTYGVVFTGIFLIAVIPALQKKKFFTEQQRLMQRLQQHRDN